jgi:hypothetical protein
LLHFISDRYTVSIYFLGWFRVERFPPSPRLPFDRLMTFYTKGKLRGSALGRVNGKKF